MWLTLATLQDDATGAACEERQLSACRRRVPLRILEADLAETAQRLEERNEIAQAFEDVARHLADLDIDEIWAEADERERWMIASDLLDEIAIYPDHLEIKVSGSPRMNVTLQEVGLKPGSGFQGVGERSLDESDHSWRLKTWGSDS